MLLMMFIVRTSFLSTDRQEMQMERLSMAHVLHEESQRCGEADGRLRRLQKALAKIQVRKEEGSICKELLIK